MHVRLLFILFFSSSQRCCQISLFQASLLIGANCEFPLKWCHGCGSYCSFCYQWAGEQSTKWSSNPLSCQFNWEQLLLLSFPSSHRFSTLPFRWHRETPPESPVAFWGELLRLVWSHLTDVVVDGVRVPLARWVTHQLEHAVFVRVDLGHRHVYAVRVVVSSLCSVGRYRLRNTKTLVSCCSHWMTWLFVSLRAFSWSNYLYFRQNQASCSPRLTFFMLS